MSTLREAAQQALDFIVATNKSSHFWLVPESNLNKTVTALRAALAQQDEPLNLADPAVQKRLAAQWGYVPAAQAEPVQEPVAWNWMLDGLPYGRACYGDPPDADLAERAATAGRTVRLLYAAPPQRRPLTEEEKRALADKFPSCQPESYEVSGVFDLISAVERAHGIKE